MAAGDITTNTLYKDRPEFKDVVPIYNSKVEDGIVPIALNEEFTDAFAYLRALMNAEEISERAFALTETCARLNPANYSVWEYRRKILKGLGKSLEDELQFCEESILENLKNYQVWHHRRELMLWMNKKEIDMTFVDEILNDDVKNYHAWQHRVFLVRHFKVPLKTELRFSTEFISRDVFNNSAWNYRFFIVTELSDNFEKTEIINDEIQFTLNYIQAAVNNASTWSYLSGLMEFSTFTAHPEVLNFTRKLLLPPDAPEGAELNISKSAENTYALSFLAEAMITLIEEKHPKPDALQTARDCYERLIVIDPLRKRLWNYKLHELFNLAAV